MNKDNWQDEVALPERTHMSQPTAVFDTSERLSPARSRSRVRTASEQEKEVLRAFMTDIKQPRYGYDLHKQTGVDHSTIYNMLLRMVSQGYLEGEWQLGRGKGKPKRFYTLTEEGLSYAARQLAS